MLQRIFSTSKGRRAWVLVGWAILLGICIGSLMPSPPRLAGGDKLHHFAAYGLAAFWWCALHTEVRLTLRAIVGLIIMGVVIEFLQGASGYRHFEVADMWINALGAISGGALSFTLPASRFQSSTS